MNPTVRSIAMQIALVAMLLHALLPTGWMPNVGGAGNAPFVICTIHGALRQSPDATDRTFKHKPAQDDGRQHDICPFAAASHFATPVSFALAVGPASVVAVGVPPQGRQIVDGLKSYRPQSPRAPPHYA